MDTLGRAGCDEWLKWWAGPAYVDIESWLTNELPVKLAVNSVQDLLPAEEKAGLGVWKADLANLTEKSIICWDNLCGKRGILIEWSIEVGSEY